MAETTAQEEIIDLTELIEKGSAPSAQTASSPDAAASPSVTPSEQQAQTAQKSPIQRPDQTSAKTLNDPPSSGEESDLDVLLAQIAQAPDQTQDDTAAPRSVDPHEKLDMSSLDEADDLFSGLKFSNRDNSSENPPNAIDNLLNSSNENEQSQTATPDKEIQESVNNDLNDLLSSLDNETAKGPGETAPTTAKESSSEDINALLGMMETNQENTPQSKNADDLDALLGEISDEHAAQSQQNASPDAEAAAPANDFDTILGEMQAEALGQTSTQNAKAVSSTDDLDALLGSMQNDTAPTPKADAATPAQDDLDALLGETAQTDAKNADPAPADKTPSTDDIDALLGAIQNDTEETVSELPTEDAALSENLAALLNETQKTDTVTMSDDTLLAGNLETLLSNKEKETPGTAKDPSENQSPLPEENLLPSAAGDMTTQNATETIVGVEGGMGEEESDSIRSDSIGANKADTAETLLETAAAIGSESPQKMVQEARTETAGSTEEQRPNQDERTEELETRLATFDVKLAELQTTLNERLEICETGLSDLQLALESLRSDMQSGLAEKKLLAEDSMLSQHIEKTITTALENGMQKLLQDMEKTQQNQTNLNARIDALDQTLAGTSRAEIPSFEHIQKLLEEKTAGLSQGIMKEELEERLNSVILATEKTSREFRILHQKIDELSDEISNKFEERIQRALDHDNGSRDELQERLAASQRENDILTARIDGLEKRIDSLEPTFNARIDKAAAGAAARILREELKKILETM
ncbi:MAG: hypothetical protein K5657_03885 [Desulfovibrio sp.]|nr:hypothetical protein [Desulfovibrio sp.]